MNHEHDTTVTASASARRSAEVPPEFEQIFRAGRVRGIAGAALVGLTALGALVLYLGIALATCFAGEDSTGRDCAEPPNGSLQAD